MSMNKTSIYNVFSDQVSIRSNMNEGINVFSDQYSNGFNVNHCI